MAQRPKILESPNAKGALLEKFLDDYLREQHARPVSLVELSRAMNISRRSLHRAFCDVFDLRSEAPGLGVFSNSSLRLTTERDLSEGLLKGKSTGWG